MNAVSYAVCRMQKMKSHDLKGMQFHNQRERESKTNPDIDKSKNHLNYDLHNSAPIDYNKRVKEIIESQKEGTRKTRKDAVLVNELLVTSDRDFFDRLDPNEQKRFFKESYELFAERYGEQNIAYATVHNDEKTPHLHLGVVPMRDGSLQGKNVFNRKELLWMQDEFPKHMQKMGFDLERGEKGSTREHIETQTFKKQTLAKDIKDMENALESKYRALERIQRTEITVEDISRRTEPVKSLKRFVGVKDEEKIQMPKKDHEELLRLAEKGSGAEGLVNRAKEEADMYLGMVSDEVEEGSILRDLNKQTEKENMNLKSENAELKKENKILKERFSLIEEWLKDTIPKWKEKWQQWFLEPKNEKKVVRKKDRDQGMER